MSEQGLSVGGGYSISANGQTEIIYIQYNSINQYNEYKINNGNPQQLNMPVLINNTNIDPSNNILKIFLQQILH